MPPKPAAKRSRRRYAISASIPCGTFLAQDQLEHPIHRVPIGFLDRIVMVVVFGFFLGGAADHEAGTKHLKLASQSGRVAFGFPERVRSLVRETTADRIAGRSYGWQTRGRRRKVRHSSSGAASHPKVRVDPSSL